MRDYILDGTHFVAIGLGVSAPQIRDFAVPFDVISFFFVFGFFKQPTLLNGFLRKIGQMTLFWERKCLLGVPLTIFYL